MSEENIRGVFAKFGTIRHVRMNQNTNSRPGAGFGFVTFSSPQEAEAALSERDSIYFNNLQVIKQLIKEKIPFSHQLFFLKNENSRFCFQAQHRGKENEACWRSRCWWSAWTAS